MNTIRSAHSEASAVVYDASRVSLTGDGDGVRIRTSSCLSTLPMPELNEVVGSVELPNALRRVDALVRKALPAPFTEAFEERARRGYVLEPLPSLDRDTSARLTVDQMRSGVTGFWGGDIAGLRSDEAGKSVQAVIYGRVPIVLAVDSSHGQVNGGIALDDGFLAHCFGTWLLADHPDATGLRRVNELIDRWARLRLGLPPR